ncbi:SCO family protein [Trebonia kvetii]|nr:SCO family protein [Trebonia kvetii]
MLSSRRQRRLLTLASAVTALAAVTAGCSSSTVATASDGGSAPGMVLINTSKYKGNIITPVTKPVGTLTDDLGKPFSIKNDTAGVVTLLFFGYTHCPDECPLTMSNTGAAFRMIPAADRAKIRVLFVSVDPGRDTPARLRSWLGNFNPAFIGLRGSLAQVEALEKQTGLPIGQTFKDSAGEAQLDHATEMFAFSTDNVATEAFFPSTPPANMANDLKLLVAGGKPS